MLSRSTAQQIEELKQQISSLAREVESGITHAVEAFLQHDRILAQRVIDADARIDLKEIEVEELCVSILAAELDSTDLRFVVAVLKSNNDLERIGDLSRNIAETVQTLVAAGSYRRLTDCDAMARQVETMVGQSIRALLNHDVKLAQQVIEYDDKIDALQRSMQSRILDAVYRSLEDPKTLMRLNFIVRQLERVGDMATNIAEDVIYMVDGSIVRHASLRQRLRPI